MGLGGPPRLIRPRGDDLSLSAASPSSGDLRSFFQARAVKDDTEDFTTSEDAAMGELHDLQIPWNSGKSKLHFLGILSASQTQQPYMVWYLAPKSLKYESLEP